MLLCYAVYLHCMVIRFPVYEKAYSCLAVVCLKIA